MIPEIISISAAVLAVVALVFSYRAYTRDRWVGKEMETLWIALVEIQDLMDSKIPGDSTVGNSPVRHAWGVGPAWAEQQTKANYGRTGDWSRENAAGEMVGRDDMPGFESERQTKP